MIQEYQALINNCMMQLCEGVDPQKVMDGLFRIGVFQKFDVEKVGHEKTDQQKVERIMDILMLRDFNALSEFIKILNSIDHSHSDLARVLQPVKYDVVWFASSPSHAAAIVHILEQHAGAKFSKMRREGKYHSLVVRRARIFPREVTSSEIDQLSNVEESVSHSHEVEVCLVFTASNVSVMTGLENLFKEEFVSRADLLLMCGCSMILPVSGRRVVIVTEVINEEGGEKVCTGLTKDEIDSLKRWFTPKEPNIKTRVTFNSLDSTHQIPKLDCAEDFSDDSVVNVNDDLAFKFYSLCRERFPGKRSVVAKTLVPRDDGVVVDGMEGILSSESIAAIDVLMEICKHYYNN